MRRSLLAFFLLALFPASAWPQVEFLRSGWKVRSGDSIQWADPAYDHSGWKDATAPQDWEDVLGEGYDGFGWYRREVTLPEGLGDVDHLLGMMLTVGDAFEVYWNGERIGTRGGFPPTFIESPNNSVVLVPPQTLARARNGKHVVAIRVYNYYAFGGLGPVRIGPYEALLEIRSPGILAVGILISFILAIGLYHLVFFFWRRSARENLYFAVLCLLISAYGSVFSPGISALVAPYIIPYRVSLMAMMAAGPFFMALVYRLFDLRFGRRERWVSGVFAATFLVAAWLPLDVMTTLNRAIMAAVVLGFVLIVVRAYRAVSRHRRHTWVLVAGTAAFAATMTYDQGALNRLVPRYDLIPGVFGTFWGGFLLFVVSVGIATAGKWAVAEATALVDPLTELSRRHVFEDALRRETERLRRGGGSVAVLLIDLDHFKSVNDTWGHSTGDRVLARVGRLLRLTARNADVTSRYGGEEFAVLLYETGLAGAVSFAERFRRGLRDLEMQVPGGVERVTASVGVAVGTEVVDPDALLEAADRMLYRAKHGGRDRVVAVALPEMREIAVDTNEKVMGD